MITILQNTFFDALNKCKGTIHNNAFNPYFQTVVIKQLGDNLVLQTTNMEASTQTNVIDFQGNLENIICVNFQDLFNIIGKYKKDDNLTLSISVKESSLSYLIISKGSRSIAELPMLDGKDFPAIQDIEKVAYTIVCDKTELLTAIEKTKICIYPNETRYNVNGLHFSFNKEQKNIDIVSTDGHRLAKFKIEDSKLDIFEDLKITIPRKIVFDIASQLKNTLNDVKFELNDNKTKLRIDFGNHFLITKLIDADFPDYERVIPKDNNLIARIPQTQFLQAIERLSSIIKNTNEITVMMVFKDTILSMSCQENNKKTIEEIDIDFEGEIIIKANIFYLKELVQGISSREFNLKMKDSISPFLLKDIDDARLLYTVMPMRG